MIEAQQASHSAALVVSGLVKHFDRRMILDNVNLYVHPSEAVALVGHNGAGKSTTLRCIVSELQKDQGTITICGADLDLEPLKAKSNLGYAADDPFLYPYLTGREHIELWRAFRKISTSSLTDAWQLTKKLALENALDTQVRTYSRGMRQKLAFVGAIFHHPGLIILDEPFTATDQEARNTAIELLRLAQNDGTALVFTTHQQEIIEQLSASTITLSQGATGSVLPFEHLTGQMSCKKM